MPQYQLAEGKKPCRLLHRLVAEVCPGCWAIALPTPYSSIHLLVVWDGFAPHGGTLARIQWLERQFDGRVPDDVNVLVWRFHLLTHDELGRHDLHSTVMRPFATRLAMLARRARCRATVTSFKETACDS